jgi:hypothetical protein
LIRAALDWSRAGIGTGLPLDVAPKLMAAVAGTQDPVLADELYDTKGFATKVVLGGSGRKTRTSVLTLADVPRPSFHRPRLPHRPRPVTQQATIWDTALVEAKDPHSGDALGLGAMNQDRFDIATKAFTPAAEAGKDEAAEALSRPHPEPDK